MCVLQALVCLCPAGSEAQVMATVAEVLPSVSLYTPRSKKGGGGGVKVPVMDGVTSAGTVSLIGYVCFYFVYLFTNTTFYYFSLLFTIIYFLPVSFFLITM
jgi:hypothetical protein